MSNNCGVICITSELFRMKQTDCLVSSLLKLKSLIRTLAVSASTWVLTIGTAVSSSLAFDDFSGLSLSKKYRHTLLSIKNLSFICSFPVKLVIFKRNGMCLEKFQRLLKRISVTFLFQHILYCKCNYLHLPANKFLGKLKQQLRVFRYYYLSVHTINFLQRYKNINYHIKWK